MEGPRDVSSEAQGTAGGTTSAWGVAMRTRPGSSCVWTACVVLLLAGVVAVSLLVGRVAGADMSFALALPNVVIPPVQGKTGSFDIMEVDQAAHRLYVADRTDTGVDVFDVSSPAARYLKTIPAGTGTNGVSVAKNVNKLFVTTNDSRVLIVDVNPPSPHYDTVIASLSTGGKKRTDELDYDPRDRKMYVANSDDGIVTAIDAVGNRIIKRFLNLGDGLEQPRYDAGNGMMYLTSSDQNAVFQFDPARDVLVKKFDVGAACNPNGLGINPKTNQALLGCSNKKTPMAALWDLNAGKVIQTFTQVGAGDMMLYSPQADLFFFAASNYPPAPVMGVFTATGVHWVANIPTLRGAHAVAFDETNHVLYTINQAPNQAGLIAFWLQSIPR